MFIAVLLFAAAAFSRASDEMLASKEMALRVALRFEKGISGTNSSITLKRIALGTGETRLPEPGRIDSSGSSRVVECAFVAYSGNLETNATMVEIVFDPDASAAGEGMEQPIASVPLGMRRISGIGDAAAASRSDRSGMDIFRRGVATAQINHYGNLAVAKELATLIDAVLKEAEAD